MSDFEQQAVDELVAVGATEAESVRIWLRSRPGTHLLRIEGEDGSDARVGTFEVPDVRGRDGTTSVRYPQDFGGEPLRPLTRYRFRVERDADHAEVGSGRFRTSPRGAGDAPDRFSIAIVSCHQPFRPDGGLHEPAMRMLTVLEELLERQGVERVILAGDQMYADYPEGLSLFDSEHFRAVGPPGRERLLDCTVDEIRGLYQHRYRIFWGVEPFRRLQAGWPCYAILDDHEIVDNFGSAPEHAEPEWAALRDGALDAAWDYQYLRQVDRTENRPPAMDFPFTYGPVAGFVMDLRSQRRREGDRLRVFGDDQLARLERFLSAHGDRDVMLLVLSVPLVHIADWMSNLAAAITGEGSDAADRFSYDPANESRERLVRLLHRHQKEHPTQQIVLLGGDIHVGSVSRIDWNVDGLPPVFQLVSSAVSNVLSPLASFAAGLIPYTASGLHVGEEICCDAELAKGREGSTNPFTGLNVGIVELERQANGRYGVRLELFSHDDGDPPRPVLVYDTGLIPPP